MYLEEKMKANDMAITQAVLGNVYSYESSMPLGLELGLQQVYRLPLLQHDIQRC